VDSTLPICLTAQAVRVNRLDADGERSTLSLSIGTALDGLQNLPNNARRSSSEEGERPSLLNTGKGLAATGDVRAMGMTRRTTRSHIS
jgi:hypothetical protein